MKSILRNRSVISRRFSTSEQGVAWSKCEDVTTDVLRVDVDEKRAIARLTIDRPRAYVFEVTPRLHNNLHLKHHRLNALNTDVILSIRDAYNFLDASDNIRCLILTGSEKAFAAGVVFSLILH